VSAVRRTIKSNQVKSNFHTLLRGRMFGCGKR
jgi:hypothetical protein